MKLHLCCGDVYLNGYINCDVQGRIVGSDHTEGGTTLEKYYQNKFEIDRSKRKKKEIIINCKMDILNDWLIHDGIVKRIVMVSAFEHFEHEIEIPHIISEAHRVLGVGGVWKFDFPDILRLVREWYDNNDEFMMELIYCNHKDIFSVHKWGYTRSTISNYLTPDMWNLEFKDVVKHDYPMIGVWAIKK